MSTYGVDALNVTVTAFAPAAAALMLLAYQMAWLTPFADTFGTANRYVLPAESTTEVTVEVRLFQPMAKMLVLPAVCAFA